MDDYLDIDKLFDPSNGGMIEMVQLPDIFLGHPTVRVTVGTSYKWINRIFLDDHYFIRSLTMKWLFLMLIPENSSPRRLSTTSLELTRPATAVVIYNLCKHSFQWTLIVWFVLGCNNSKIIEKLFVIFFFHFWRTVLKGVLTILNAEDWEIDIMLKAWVNRLC